MPQKTNFSIFYRNLDNSRSITNEPSELDQASKELSIPLYTSLTPIKENSTVIGRYSVLPFYKELETELAYKNCKLINTFEQHCWIANFDWYHNLKEFTFPSYTQNEFPYLSNEEKDNAWIVKGCTNSLKHLWNSHMFAQDFKTAIQVSIKLRQDSLIQNQSLIFRKYIPLETFEHSVSGTPITNEWRFFILNNTIIDYGYYWINAENPLDKTQMDPSALEFINKIIPEASKHASFYVLDIAKTQDGKWILVEINDGQMSGLSGINPTSFYKSLNTLITK